MLRPLLRCLSVAVAVAVVVPADRPVRGVSSDPPPSCLLAHTAKLDVRDPFAKASYAERFDFLPLTSAIEHFLSKVDLPGAAMIVLNQDGVLYQQCFGDYRQDTVVSIASASKWLSAAALMSLVDDGLIDLDRPISQYLPEFTGSAGTITTRQLFSHTSGLTVADAARGNVTMTLKDSVAALAQRLPVAAPGSEFHYGGVSMQIAGRIGEVVTGKPWTSIFAERIALPLQMRHTTYGRRTTNPNPQLAGGMSSTLHDYASFLLMVQANGTLDGVRVLSPWSVYEMGSDQTRGAKMVRASPIRRASGAGYGIGNWVDMSDPDGTGRLNSSPGLFGFTPWIDRERAIAAVFVLEDRSGQRRRAAGAVPDVRRIVARIIDAARAHW